MQHTVEAVSYIHGQAGFLSRQYLDDFGGAERLREEAQAALGKLQEIMEDLGTVEAKHKVCGTAQTLVWLGLYYNSIEMTISIPEEKLGEIMALLKEWEGRQRAMAKELQSLIGTLQFVAGVSPPTRVFTNRMFMEAPKQGSESLSCGFKQDLQFFLNLLPHFNGKRTIDKADIDFQDWLELDAHLSGCSVCTDSRYYANRFRHVS